MLYRMVLALASVWRLRIAWRRFDRRETQTACSPESETLLLKPSTE